MCSVWNTQYIAVSPIRGGSLPAIFLHSISLIRFPHTRGKFTFADGAFQDARPFPPYAGEVYYDRYLDDLDELVSPIRGGSLL